MRRIIRVSCFPTSKLSHVNFTGLSLMRESTVKHLRIKALVWQMQEQMGN